MLVRVICARLLQASMFFNTASSSPERCLCPSLSMACKPPAFMRAAAEGGQRRRFSGSSTLGAVCGASRNDGGMHMLCSACCCPAGLLLLAGAGIWTNHVAGWELCPATLQSNLQAIRHAHRHGCFAVLSPCFDSRRSRTNGQVWALSAVVRKFRRAMLLELMAQQRPAR